MKLFLSFTSYLLTKFKLAIFCCNTFRASGFFTLLLAGSFTSYADDTLSFSKAKFFDLNQEIHTNYYNYFTGYYYRSRDAISQTQYTLFGDKFYFVIEGHAMGDELWSYEPISKKEILVSDINWGLGSSSPKDLTVLGNYLYFSAFTEETGRELWRFDSKLNKSILLKDFTPGVDADGNAKSSEPIDLFVHDNKLFFFLTVDEENRELWSYEPSTNKYQKIYGTDFDGEFGYYHGSSSFDGKLYIFYRESRYSLATDVVIFDSASNEYEEGELGELETILASPHIQIGEKIIAGYQSQLVEYDLQTQAMTTLLNGDRLGFYEDELFTTKWIENQFVLHKGDLYFNANYDGESARDVGYELYRYNFANDTLTLVKDFEGGGDIWGPYSSEVSSVTEYNERLYFSVLFVESNRTFASYDAETGKIRGESQSGKDNNYGSNIYSLTPYNNEFYTASLRSGGYGSVFWSVEKVDIEDFSMQVVESGSLDYDEVHPDFNIELFNTHNKFGYITTAKTITEIWQLDEVSGTYEKTQEIDSNWYNPSTTKTIGNTVYIGIYNDRDFVYNSQTKQLTEIPFALTYPTLVGNNAYFYKENTLWYLNSGTAKLSQVSIDNFDSAKHQDLTILFAANGNVYFYQESEGLVFEYNVLLNEFVKQIDASQIFEGRVFVKDTIQIDDKVLFGCDVGDGVGLCSFNMEHDVFELIGEIVNPVEVYHPYRRYGTNPYSFIEYNGDVYFVAAGRESMSLLWKYSPNSNQIKYVKAGKYSELFQVTSLMLLEDKLFTFGNVISGVKRGQEPIILELNHEPTFELPQVDNVNKYQRTTLSVVDAADNDNEELSYLWRQVSGPSVMIENATSAEASFIAPKVFADEALIFEAIVSDGHVDIAKQVATTVLYSNETPELEINATSESSYENEVITLQAEATDDDELTYTWQQLSGSNAEIADVNQATASITLPSVNEDSVVEFEVTVSDGEFDVTETIAITVLKINQPPTVTIEALEASYDEGTQVSLIAQASDEQSLTYEWSQVSGPTVNIVNPNVAETQITLPLVTADIEVVFQVMVSDGEFEVSSSTSFIVKNKVAPKNENVQENKSGGGMMFWLLFLLTSIAMHRRLKKLKGYN